MGKLKRCWLTWLVEWALATPVQFMAGDTFYTAAWSGEMDGGVDESVGRSKRCWLTWRVEQVLATPVQFMAGDTFYTAAWSGERFQAGLPLRRGWGEGESLVR